MNIIKKTYGEKSIDEYVERKMLVIHKQRFGKSGRVVEKQEISEIVNKQIEVSLSL
nr:hypothetical protein [Brevibacillus laterosporus]